MRTSTQSTGRAHPGAFSASKMHALASEARAIANSVRENTRKMEEVDLNARIAAWKKREQEKAQRAVAQLPAVIKDLAGEGKFALVVRVQVTPPYVSTEISETYKVLSWVDFRSLLDTETPNSGKDLSLGKTRNLREGARPIARWALRQGLKVRYCKWEEENFRRDFGRIDVFDVDRVEEPVLGNSKHYDWPVHEGFVLRW